MTDDHTDAPTDATPNSDLLLQELKTLNAAPILQRGDAAVRLASLTVAVIRRLEMRLTRLEGAASD